LISELYIPVEIFYWFIILDVYVKESDGGFMNLIDLLEFKDLRK